MREQGGGKVLQANLRGVFVQHLLFGCYVPSLGKDERDEQTKPL